MRKYIWLLVLAVPPWLASEMDAPKWVVFVAIAPFFLCAMRLDNSEEDLLGDSGPAFRKVVLLPILFGGLALVYVFFTLWQIFFPGH